MEKMSIINDFLIKVQAIFKSGSATEHSYRPALADLFNALDKNVHAINEPKRVECGAPDFIIQRGEIAVGHVEAKDIPINISKLKDANKNQLERYKKALPNLIYTNCLDWIFYRNEEPIANISIADLLLGIQPLPESFDTLEALLQEFISQKPETITSAKELAIIMAGKAGLIKEILFNALKADEGKETEIAQQYHAFKLYLIHDIAMEDFADIYAETVAYGMFAARLHDDATTEFTRLRALDLLPKSNPFLLNLFSYIAGPNLDERVKWVINDLAAALNATNIKRIKSAFKRASSRNDPFIHFYETFLAAYNPEKRRSRGVWYTPEQVVNFIINTVNEVLVNEFNLSDGLADTSKIMIDWDTGQKGKKGVSIVTKKEVHRVQILDPAVGTGTFLADVIKYIEPKVKGIAPALWSSYIEEDLVPRLHGFELLMASYAMCHLKIDMTLRELGYVPSEKPPRTSVYLTNSLEEGDAANQTLPFAQWLSNEVKHANTIKTDMPIMCVIGNPPYAAKSANTGDWITGLIEDYKYINGVHFGEKKHWLHDDYVKFVRMSEHFISKNGEGVIGFITNHGYLTNPTFRGMRHHLMKTFDKIFVLDLHGNSNKREVCPDGTPDKNVFDIRQGTAILIAVKTSQDESLARVYHHELWGDRAGKYARLVNGSIMLSTFTEIYPQDRFFMFSNIDMSIFNQYDQGFSIDKFMPTQCTGIITARDHLAVDLTKNELVQKIEEFLDDEKSPEQARAQYFPKKTSAKYPAGDTRDWKLVERRKKLKSKSWTSSVKPILFRPFDTRHICYDGDMVDWPRFEVMRTFNYGTNFALLVPRMTSDEFSPLVTDKIVSNKTASRYDQTYFFPLYVYLDTQVVGGSRVINYDNELFERLKILGTFNGRIPDEMDAFDYIYGTLSSRTYRKQFSDFLEIDFPKIPWPLTPIAFWEKVSLGKALRELHLMSSMPAISGAIIEGDGDLIIGNYQHKDNNVYINNSQRICNISNDIWEFQIGGYQPAQKWLKDRIGRKMTFDDIKAYRLVLYIISETERLLSNT